MGEGRYRPVAEVIGYLKEDSTSGERQVLRALSDSLPRDFAVYVECPLHDENMERMPDFIILAPFGVVILEVKDWVYIVEADKFYAMIRTRSGGIRRHKSPVSGARGLAHILARKLERVPALLGERHRLKIPWGYAVVLPNLDSTPINQLRKPWGWRYVLGMEDLRPHVIAKRLKATLPFDYDLQSTDLRYVRSVINPVALITSPDRARTLVIDEVQERIVTESPRVSVMPLAGPESPVPQAEPVNLFTPSEPDAAASSAAPLEQKSPVLESVTRNFSIRLVRGVAGSGKTLVLMQRARYLAAQHPRWRIGVFTFNNPLVQSLRASLKGIPNVKVTSFHKQCSALLRQHTAWHSPHESAGWLKNHAERWPIVAQMGVEFVQAEIRWIKEVGIETRAEYLEVERKGRGQSLQRGGRRRQAIYDVLEAYNNWLAEQRSYDWADVPYLVLEGLDSGSIFCRPYDAVLIDEAQDFAPSWIQVIKRLLKPDSGLIFLADDPSQSIYRYYSWREKGIPVVGRTRWLRVPYRNTREIYRAAYEVIREDELLRQNLEEQLGLTLEPDLNSEYLRSGPRPQLREFRTPDNEFDFIRSEVEWLLQKGLDAREIAVLHRRRRGVGKLQQVLQGTGVEVSTFHAFKGLEFETVFLSQMQLAFPEGVERSEQALSEERRLVYMAMTRARERLYLGYEGHWPAPMEGVCAYAERAIA